MRRIMEMRPITRERSLTFMRTMAREAVFGLLGWPQQFTPFSSEKKNTDSCVIGNAVIKSGKFLISGILEYLGRWENIEVRIANTHWDRGLPHGDVEVHKCLHQFAVKKLRNGQMVLGTLPWTRGLGKSIGEVTPTRRIKHIFIYRDPRDVFVSYLNFVTYSEKYSRGRDTRKYQRFMLENFSSDDERLTYIIKKGRSANSGELNYLSRVYEPWLRSPHCLAIKFEDLYPEVINLKKGVLGKVLRSLLDYLEVGVDTVDPLELYSKVYGKGPTATSLVRKVGQYKRVFKDHHYALIDNPEFRSILNTFGYKW
jgi:hypothetical protein